VLPTQQRKEALDVGLLDIGTRFFDKGGQDPVPAWKFPLQQKSIGDLTLIFLIESASKAKAMPQDQDFLPAACCRLLRLLRWLAAVYPFGSLGASCSLNVLRIHVPILMKSLRLCCPQREIHTCPWLRNDRYPFVNILLIIVLV
jgi:hypothetical protein